MHDRCPIKGVCSESCDVLTFWEITDNISDTQKRYNIVANFTTEVIRDLSSGANTNDLE